MQRRSRALPVNGGCEVCVRSGHAEAARGRIRRLLVGTRIVTLCASHAEHVERGAVTDFEALRALFPEAEGRRSLLERRAPLDRRVFPPRPEGRRRGGGRRSDDPA